MFCLTLTQMACRMHTSGENQHTALILFSGVYEQLSRKRFNMFDHPGKLREIRGKYKEIESEDEEEEELKVSCFATYKQDSRTIKHVSFSIILLLAFLISMSAGFIAGKTLPKLTLSVSDFLIGFSPLVVTETSIYNISCSSCWKHKAYMALQQNIFRVPV